MNQRFLTKRGFSLVELLIIVAIMIGVSGVTYFSFEKFSAYQTLEKETDVAHSYIEKARLQAVNSKNFSDYGIRFSSTGVVLFEGSAYSAGAATNTTYTLSPKIQISSISLSNGASEVYFNNVSGEPSATGTITFRIINATSTKTIYLYGTGLSEVI